MFDESRSSPYLYPFQRAMSQAGNDPPSPKAPNLDRCGKKNYRLLTLNELDTTKAKALFHREGTQSRGRSSPILVFGTLDFWIYMLGPGVCGSTQNWVTYTWRDPSWGVQGQVVGFIRFKVYRVTVPLLGSLLLQRQMCFEVSQG